MVDFTPPEEGEIIVATVKKVVQYGVFCSLDEYPTTDTFIHISEVSSGWIRNIRDHVREGQKIVAIVLRVDKEKRQVDSSLKRVSEADKKRKLESFNLNKRAAKLLERAALKLGKKPEATSEIAPALIAEFGDLHGAFEKASETGQLPASIPKAWATAIIEIAKVEIKPKRVEIRATLTLRSYASDGLAIIKKVLAAIKAMKNDPSTVTLHYLGAPKYYVDVTATDFKTAEKLLVKIQKTAETAAGSNDVELSLVKDKN